MKKLRFFIPAVLFYVLIFAVSSQDHGIGLPVHGFDKVAHIIEYSFLGFFLSLGHFNAFRSSASARSVLTFLTGLMLGALDELHQFFVPGRTSAIGDVIADAAGIICGILAYLYLVRKRQRAREQRPA